MQTNPQPGEVYVADLGYAAKPRMVLIVSARAPAAPLAVALALSLTSKYHGTPYEVVLPKLPWMREQSHVNAQSLSGFKFLELDRLLGKLEPAVMEKVKAALKLWLGL